MRKISLLILLATVVVPCQATSNISALMMQQDVSSELGMSAKEHSPWLTVADLFAISVLPEITCFDGPPRSRIESEWINIADVLGNSNSQSGCAIEMISSDYEVAILDFPEPTITGSFSLALYGLEAQLLELLVPPAQMDPALLLGLEFWR